MSAVSVMRGAACLATVLLLATVADAQRRQGPGFHFVTVPTVARVQSPNTSSEEVLLDTPHLDLQRVWIPASAKLQLGELPEARTVQVLSGEGAVRIGASEHPLNAQRILFLAPRMPLEIQSSKDKALLLLVHRAESPCPRGPRAAP